MRKTIFEIIKCVGIIGLMVGFFAIACQQNKTYFLKKATIDGFEAVSIYYDLKKCQDEKQIIERLYPNEVYKCE